MAMPKLEFPTGDTLQDALERLGSVPLNRIRWTPRPGTAREEDVLARPDGEKRLLELIDGVLVEKPMGYYESVLAGVLIHALWDYLEVNDLGTVFGEAGTVRLREGLVLVPDVSFYSWTRFANRELPAEQIPDLVPDLAVEVISPSNTPAEMERKLREYFASGTRLAWLVYPATRTVRVYHDPDQYTTLTDADTIQGGDLLPGFQLSISAWFEQAGRRRGQ